MFISFIYSIKQNMCDNSTQFYIKQKIGRNSPQKYC